jgi:hypothetical protein
MWKAAFFLSRSRGYAGGIIQLACNKQQHQLSVNKEFSGIDCVDSATVNPLCSG